MNYIVVPDGLAADQNGTPLPAPSFVYKSVLDELLKVANTSDQIYLAPANKFGGEVSEQQVAHEYLLKMNGDLNVISFETHTSSYIDTRGNAVHLREYLKSIDSWPIGDSCLVVYNFHYFRARLAFEQEGFSFRKSLLTKVKLGHEPIVNRLFYYKFKALHGLYELSGYLLYLFRVK